MRSKDLKRLELRKKKNYGIRENPLSKEKNKIKLEFRNRQKLQNSRCSQLQSKMTKKFKDWREKELKIRGCKRSGSKKSKISKTEEKFI